MRLDHYAALHHTWFGCDADGNNVVTSACSTIVSWDCRSGKRFGWPHQIGSDHLVKDHNADRFERCDLTAFARPP
jgi:hypothetical protein